MAQNINFDNASSWHKHPSKIKLMIVSLLKPKSKLYEPTDCFIIAENVSQKNVPNSRSVYNFSQESEIFLRKHIMQILNISGAHVEKCLKHRMAKRLLKVLIDFVFHKKL